jgi:hypothetical protein
LRCAARRDGRLPQGARPAVRRTGLRAGEPGEWRALPGGIEGYTPSPGQQQVVRVKRFETGGDAPAVHFVFDMVVESRTAQ